MLQKTYKRIEKLENIYKPLIILMKNIGSVGHQMKEINVEPLSILLEPQGRDTTPAITIAALRVLEIFKNTNIEPILLILSSDHQIENIKKFQLAIKNSINEASKGNLIIFGVPPTYPATGNGYIKTEDQLNQNKCSARSVNQFIEKPDKQTAESLVKDKKYSWNSGMFVFQASAF